MPTEGDGDYTQAQTRETITSLIDSHMAVVIDWYQACNSEHASPNSSNINNEEGDDGEAPLWSDAENYKVTSLADRLMRIPTIDDLDLWAVQVHVSPIFFY